MRRLLAFALVLASLVPTPAFARTLVAGRDARTLVETVAMASDGDRVVVPAGTWSGPVRIERSITLEGSGTIDGGGEGSVITVAAAGVVVRSLTVRASGSNLSRRDACIYTEPAARGVRIEDTHVTDCAFGIWIHQSPRARVIGNRVRGRADERPTDRGNGIHLFDADEVLVRDNEVRDSRDGIYVSATDDSTFENNRVIGQRYGVHYMYSYRNTLRGNTANENIGGFALMESRDLLVEDNVATDNERVGLLFRDAQDCRILRNRLERNGQGMFFFSSTDNLIEDNRLVANEIGAKIWAGSLRNVVRGNVFSANAQQVFFVGAEDLVWGDGDRGNRWSDYIGWDQDGDGIGDRPHRVDSFTANLVHEHPSAVLLMRSPAMELLTHLEARVPILRVATVVDLSPLVGGS